MKFLCSALILAAVCLSTIHAGPTTESPALARRGERWERFKSVVPGTKAYDRARRQEGADEVMYAYQ
ncbi:hypothetical protein H4R34_002748 [Dimargaris verticillata]|uniref:Uncharacterized protein n=1 Tax=Dimargaris verticillata TaxID=2761393 RepID=A0A9W8B3I7_9FUNG|nr:hypothetical protein H4R34_002748 [Dimargaris verticillata]